MESDADVGSVYRWSAKTDDAEENIVIAVSDTGGVQDGRHLERLEY